MTPSHRDSPSPHVGDDVPHLSLRVSSLPFPALRRHRLLIRISFFFFPFLCAAIFCAPRSPPPSPPPPGVQRWDNWKQRFFVEQMLRPVRWKALLIDLRSLSLSPPHPLHARWHMWLRHACDVSRSVDAAAQTDTYLISSEGLISEITQLYTQIAANDFP